MSCKAISSFFACMLVAIVPALCPSMASAASGLVTVPTVTGHRITVAAHLAGRWQALIADFAAAGYRPRSIACFARGGHVRHSRHYVGAACDFDGSLSRSAFMRSAAAHLLIAKHGFRNGCSFAVHGIRDCGHVDDGLAGWRGGRRTMRGKGRHRSHRHGHHRARHHGHHRHR